MTNEELDKAVAESQGWEWVEDGVLSGWFNAGIHIISGLAYSPSTNWQQAGELVEKYKIDLEYVNEVWETTTWDYINNVALAEATADTPCRAICLAVLSAEGVSDE